MSRPTRRKIIYRCRPVEDYDAYEADAYITAIEQERDEAVRILHDVCETFGHVDALCVDEAVEFLGRVEGGDNAR